MNKTSRFISWGVATCVMALAPAIASAQSNPGAQPQGTQTQQHGSMGQPGSGPSRTQQPQVGQQAWQPQAGQSQQGQPQQGQRLTINEHFNRQVENGCTYNSAVTGSILTMAAGADRMRPDLTITTRLTCAGSGAQQTVTSRLRNVQLSQQQLEQAIEGLAAAHAFESSGSQVCMFTPDFALTNGRLQGRSVTHSCPSARGGGPQEPQQNPLQNMDPLDRFNQQNRDSIEQQNRGQQGSDVRSTPGADQGQEMRGTQSGDQDMRMNDASPPAGGAPSGTQQRGTNLRRGGQTIEQ